jgi:ATP-dependent Clp protease ATP-binding subunit ClpA
MSQRVTGDASTVVAAAREHARRLGHRYVGCEHLLLAVAAAGQPAGAALRAQGVTPERVEAEITGWTGPRPDPRATAGASLFGDLDRDALASIGVDLDAVRATIEASFGAQALARAARFAHRQPRPSRLNPLRALPPGLLRPWRRRARRAGRAAGRLAPAGGLRPGPARGRRPRRSPAPAAPGAAGPAGNIPFTARARKSLQNARREAQVRRDTHVGVEHIALALVAMDDGMVPPILAALGVGAPALRAAILDRYRQAS